MTKTYSEVVEKIVTNIYSLFGCVFQIQYVNDEGTWITLSESETDIQDMYRCSMIVPGADFKRIKVKIVEGCSPAQAKKRVNDCDDQDSSNLTKISRSRIEFDDCPSKNVYKTPIELDIEHKEQSISELETELHTLEERHDKLTSMYLCSVPINRRGAKQCSRCHLFQNHRKNNCPNDACVSSMMCGDVNKHSDETLELREVENKTSKLRNEIRKERLDLENKLKCKEKIMGSFSKTMEIELIKSNRDRYLIGTQFGVKPRQALINEHVAILERHYNGNIPKNIEAERAIFGNIINKAFTKLPKTPENYLTSNSVYPVEYPRKKINFASASPAPPPDPPLPAAPPPTQGHQADIGASPYFGYSWMPNPWFPDFMVASAGERAKDDTCTRQAEEETTEKA